VIPAHRPVDLPRWPATPEGLQALQRDLASQKPRLWTPSDPISSVGGCFVCFARGKVGRGRAGDMGWAGAALLAAGDVVQAVAVVGHAGAPYEPGLLALREGPLMEAAVRRLGDRPEVLLVNATGRDHPRRAGLALHLGAVLDIPTVGVTMRPLIAEGAFPADAAGAVSPLLIDDDIVGHWLRTKRGAHPVAVHAAWRTDPATALAVVLAVAGRTRTPEPIRQARRAAREARAGRRSAESA
jgi:deoxyribonuclease V